VSLPPCQLCIYIDMAVLGQAVSLPVAPLVLTESFSTLKANLLAPSPTPELLETTLLVAVVPARSDLSMERFMNHISRNSKAGILTFEEYTFTKLIRQDNHK
jgi:hypothetical protein